MDCKRVWNLACSKSDRNSFRNLDVLSWTRPMLFLVFLDPMTLCAAQATTFYETSLARCSSTFIFFCECFHPNLHFIYKETRNVRHVGCMAKQCHYVDNCHEVSVFRKSVMQLYLPIVMCLSAAMCDSDTVGQHSVHIC